MPKEAIEMTTNLEKMSEKLMSVAVPIFCEFPWDNKLAYAQWLSQTYYVTSHSTRLLGAAASRIGADEQALHVRFMDHGREEKGHHLVAGRDLKNLGFDIADFPELALSRAFVHSQYYQIEHLDPTALLGYIICLEGLAARAGNFAFEKVASAHGEKTANFLKLHGAEDIEHVQEAFKKAEALSDQRIQFIASNLEQTCELYKSLLATLETMALSSSNKQEFGT